MPTVAEKPTGTPESLALRPKMLTPGLILSYGSNWMAWTDQPITSQRLIPAKSHRLAREAEARSQANSSSLAMTFDQRAKPGYCFAF